MSGLSRTIVRNAILCCCSILAGCGGGGDVGAEPVAAEPARFTASGLLEVVGDIDLEETNDVLLVSPHVFREEGGGFLIVDSREAQARLYDRTGRLIRHFGRRGRGPGEFQRPLSGFRSPSGGLVVADLSAGLMSFDSTGQQFLGSVRPPVTPLYKALALSDTLTLLVGPRHAGGTASAAQAPPLLHVFDLSTESLVHSFFPTPGDSVVRQAARNFGWGDAIVSGDTIIAAFALVDTLYYFNRLGERIGTARIPFSRFNRIQSIPPEIRSDPVRRERWLEEQQFVNRVFALSGDRLAVQYERPRGASSQWGLVIMTRDGRRLEEHENTPMLLAVGGDSLYFVHSDSELPNRWQVVRIRG
jgi:hypothetical protein